jgi:crotonobetainyl-CoA:carnitine CoA-transferase CaiB-like acyl-CoA transferase
LIEALADLWTDVTGEPLDEGAVRITGDERALPGPFRVTLAASTCVAAVDLAAAAVRGHGRVEVSARHAAMAFRSERHLRVNGERVGSLWLGVSGDYRAADGWVKLHCNQPHHQEAALAALGVPADREAVAGAVAGRGAVEIEEAVVAAGGAAAAMRGAADWLAHPQGAAVRTEPLIAFDRIGDAPPSANRLLAGLRVLDLTHVIAGPVCGRTLAAHGADVLHVGAAHLPVNRTLVIDTGFGKRSCHLDLRTAEGRDTLRSLVAGADVLIQSYRPGSLAAKGFGPEELAEIRPGIVVLSLSAYGHSGPWQARRGFDSLVQVSCGIADEGARVAGVDEPRPLPVQALDHGTGWLAALGVITALHRRSREGGSWHVRLSLARTAWWLGGLGRTATEATQGDVADFLSEVDSPFGKIRHVRFPGSPPGWAHGPHLPGSDAPEW